MDRKKLVKEFGAHRQFKFGDRIMAKKFVIKSKKGIRKEIKTLKELIKDKKMALSSYHIKRKRTLSGHVSFNVEFIDV
jgi:hypothetical protein